MDNKTEFLDKSLKLFYLNGAKTTTMDDIAKAFSISKKTLYQQYANKDELLIQVLDYELQMLMEELQSIGSQEDCPIKKMLLREKTIKEMCETDYSIFIRQLKKYYTHLYEKQSFNIAKEISKILRNNIENGRALGLYREDFNIDEYARFLILLLFSYNDSPIININEVPREEFTQNAVIMYLNAITTEKGKNRLNKLLNNDQ